MRTETEISVGSSWWLNSHIDTAADNIVKATPLPCVHQSPCSEPPHQTGSYHQTPAPWLWALLGWGRTVIKRKRLMGAAPAHHVSQLHIGGSYRFKVPFVCIKRMKKPTHLWNYTFKPTRSFLLIYVSFVFGSAHTHWYKTPKQVYIKVHTNIECNPKCWTMHLEILKEVTENPWICPFKWICTKLL